MKKLIEKDKKLRNTLKKIEKKHFVLKSISKNCKLSVLTRWKAFDKLKKICGNASKVRLSNRCVYTYNKKRLNKFTNFSRHVYLKLIRSGKIPGMQKASW